jgi:hypothetical protein
MVCLRGQAMRKAAEIDALGNLMDEVGAEKRR